MGASARPQRLERAGRALDPLAQRFGARGHRLHAQGDPVHRGAGGEGPGGEPLAFATALGEAPLRLLAGVCDIHQALVDAVAPLAGGGGGALGAGELCSRRAQVVAQQHRARFERLPFEPCVQLGRLGLPLQRPQPGARFALDVQSPVEIVLRAVQLQLGAVAPLAVLREARSLLDQGGAIPGLGVDDRLHAALADDRVHLLPEPRVGEDLEHVHNRQRAPFSL